MPARKLAIIGAGPIGIEAAIYARTLGHDVAIYDRGDVAANMRSWGFVRLFSPWRMNITLLGRRLLEAAGTANLPLTDSCPTGNDLREKYLLPLTGLPLLSGCIHTGTNVITIGKDDFTKSELAGQSRAASPFRLLVADAQGRERIDHADAVLDCSGTYGNHRWAGRGGIPAPGEQALENRIWYTIPDVLGKDRQRFANRRTLLLGCGHSAATVLDFMQILHREHPQTHLSWAIRRPGQALQAIHGDSLPSRRQLVENALKLAESPPPWLQFFGTCVLEQLADAEDGRISATLRQLKTGFVLEADEVVALVGYTPDSAIYEQLQIHECYATAGPFQLAAALVGQGGEDCLAAGAGVSADSLKNPEPNFFILGAKSYGTSSNFVLQVGHKQIVDAFRLLSGNPKLDLYATQS